MVINFSAIDLKQRPNLVLCTAAGVPIQPLVQATKVQPDLHFNETSSLSFELPAYANGIKTPGYDDVVGMRYVLWVGVGLFILNNPKTLGDGLKEVKECIAYSSEYEFTFKQLFLEAGTYCFYDPIDNSNTIIGRILEEMPSWQIGHVDSALWSKYRTFDDTGANAYDFMKSTIQESYGCVFDFDTIGRIIHVYDTSAGVKTNPVYISLDNLAKEIEVKENTDNLFTCLDVSGAEGVSIRSVNPMGTNKIYDLSYFMTEANVGLKMVEKWIAWQNAFEDAQLPYFNTSVEYELELAKKVSAEAELATLEGELSSLEALQSVYVEASAAGDDDTASSSLKTVKSDIKAKKSDIGEQKSIIKEAENNLDVLQQRLIDFNTALAFESFFTKDELLILDRYIKEDSIQDSTFVAPIANSYTTNDVSGRIESSADVSIADSDLLRAESVTGVEVYSFTGGRLSVGVDDKKLSAKIVRGAMSINDDDSFVLTAYLNKGSFDGNSFNAGCVSITGSSSSIDSDVKVDETGVLFEGSEASCFVTDGYFFLTEDTSEYEQKSVEWDLFEYGIDTLKKLSSPTYSFSVDCGNFLSMDEFVRFRNQLTFGEKIYLNLGDMGILEPILIGCSFDYDDLTSLELEFGDTFTCSDPEFKLADLLDESISFGKSADFSKFSASKFVDSGADNAVQNFINSALNASVNAVISSDDQEVVIDRTGIRLRKWNENKQDFDDEQIWMIHNNIVFTDDNWDSAKMALGHIVNVEEGIDAWGLVADLLVGKILAGESLIIESLAPDGTTVAFRVDASGAQLHNARFDLIKGNGQITMYPETGLAAGVSTTTSPLFNYDANGNITGIRTVGGDTLTSVTQIDDDDLPNANFWIDMDGNAYFKGKVFATDGEFTGTLKAAHLDGALTADPGSVIVGTALSVGGNASASNPAGGNFYVDENGNVVMKGSINLSGPITWSSSPVQYQFSANGTSGWHSTMQSTDYYRRDSLDGGVTWGAAYQFRGTNGQDGQDGEDGSDANVPEYIQETYIDFDSVDSPTITGNFVRTLGQFQVGTGSVNNFTTRGFMGLARGMDSSGSTTYGVALANSGDLIDYSTTTTNYVIVTNAGVRMQAWGWDSDMVWSGHSLTVTPNGAFYDGVELGTGSGSGGVAVFG